jgi:hypothetical protein
MKMAKDAMSYIPSPKNRELEWESIVKLGIN